MAVTFVCLMCLANASSALDVTYSSISIKPFAEKEGSRRSLHLRICLNDVRVSGASYFGRNCARAKVEKGPGEGPWSNVIFESRYFSAFDIVTKERYKDNYKFWLREQSSRDTSSFSQFIKKQSLAEQAAVSYTHLTLPTKA